MDSFNLFKNKQRKVRQPNIIFILSDDFGHNDIGYNADDVTTPNLDYLANNGIKLSNYYTLCICSASRGVILTGRYDIFNGMRGISSQYSYRGVYLNETLISDILYKYGEYATYAIGKWHIGKSIWQQTPTWRGFEYFYGMLGGAADYFKHTTSIQTYDWSEHIGINCNDTKCARIVEEDYGIHSTYLMSQKTVEIIKNHSNYNSNDTQKPFYIYLAYQAIHSPPQVPKEYIWKYNDTIKNLKRRTAAGMINQMDEGIGNITKALIDYGLIDDTIIIFTSDNGAAIGTGDNVGGENWPFRGGKHSIYEGGTKVPAIIFYPQLKLLKNTYKYLFHSADWTPTLIEAAGINISWIIGINNKSLNNLNGKSHWKNLKSSKPKNIRSIIYYGNDNPNGAANPGNKFGLRFKKYKMLFNGGGKPDKWMKYDIINSTDPTNYDLDISSNSSIIMDGNNKIYLYDMVKDPLETNNIYNESLSSMKKIKMISRYKMRLQKSLITFQEKTSCDIVAYMDLKNITDPAAQKGGIWPGCNQEGM